MLKINETKYHEWFNRAILIIVWRPGAHNGTGMLAACWEFTWNLLGASDHAAWWFPTSDSLANASNRSKIYVNTSSVWTAYFTMHNFMGTFVEQCPAIGESVPLTSTANRHLETANSRHWTFDWPTVQSRFIDFLFWSGIIALPNASWTSR